MSSQRQRAEQVGVGWPLDLVDDLALALITPPGPSQADAIGRFTTGLVDHDPTFAHRLSQAIQAQRMIDHQHQRLAGQGHLFSPPGGSRR